MRLHILGLCLLVVSASGWAQGVRTCPASSAGDYYFAANTFESDPSGLVALVNSLKSPGGKDAATTPLARPDDSFQRQSYTSQFVALGLKSWSCGAFGEGYRFVWLRTFHHPISVSIVREAGGWVLHATELNGAGGYQPGTVLRMARVVLDAGQIEGIQRQINAVSAWSLPTNGTESGGTDGAQWIIELRDGDRYHVIDRWSPKNGPVRTLGQAFLALTGWQFPARETY